jgi:hypothetical protein
MQFAISFEHKVATERELQLTKTYEGPPFPNNDFAMSIYNKLYGMGESNDNSSTLACPPMQSATTVTRVNLCRHPACRGKNKFSNHLWIVCLNNQSSPYFQQQAYNKEYVNSAPNKQLT